MLSRWRLVNRKILRMAIKVAAMRPRTRKRLSDGKSFVAIGARLKLTREVLGMQQNEFCARADIATNTYNQYEMGKKRPSIENAIALCDAYDLTLDWIYRGDPSGLRYETADAIKALRLARED
jgi:DNA-binding XRE family transcriptional regulator